MLVTRRGLFGVIAGVSTGLVTAPAAVLGGESADALALAEAEISAVSQPGALTHAALRRLFDEEMYGAWFRSLKLESFDGYAVTFSAPVKFVRSWISEHYRDDLLLCARAEYRAAQQVDIVCRQPDRLRDAERIRAEARAWVEEV